MKISSNYISKNWAKNLPIQAPKFCQPETEEEIIELIKQHQKIRVVGSAHSWSALCSSDELLINLDKYNKVIAIDKATNTIRVQAGIKLYQLNQILDKEGLALNNLGSIAKQSLAGAIATGTHGSGISYQCLAAQIEELVILDEQGKKINLRKGEDHFNAVIISLGTFGIITEMSLKVVPAFNLRDRTYTAPFSKVMEELDE